jgi:dolichol-phosphate mannosyltransferase
MTGPEARANWQVPAFETVLWQGRARPFCVVVPVINEGARIGSLLRRMAAPTLAVSEQADIVIVDGGSHDGSLDLGELRARGVRGLLVKKGPGKLSAQLRCAYSFALDQGYRGIVTIDGNDKDDPEAIPSFLSALQQGFDFAQASRFLSGGLHANTPRARELAIRCLHAPLLRLTSGFHWTDTTQGFRAYSRRMLMDERVAPFRDVFSGYELLAYLSYRAPRLSYKCIELPTTRRYPKGQIPTKVQGWKGNVELLDVLVRACLGRYNPPSCDQRSDREPVPVEQR